MKNLKSLVFLLLGMCACHTHAQEYVDLDLPSGTLWATYNIGSSSVGDRTATTFCWGNLTENTYGDLKRWEYMYSLGNTTQGGEHDPATVAWGQDWCSPTLNQWYELLNCCRYDSHTNEYGETAVKFVRMYDTDNDGYMDTPDPSKFIVFTFNNNVTSHWVGSYWTTTQNLDSWPQDEKRDTSYVWVNDAYDMATTMEPIGHIYAEHGYAYRLSFRSDQAAVHLSLNPPSHESMIRAVRKPVEKEAQGDLNEDGEMNVTDVVTLINYIARNDFSDVDKNTLDMNGDGNVNVTDVVTLILMIAKGE